MLFRRKREAWGVTYTGTTGQQWTLWLGSRARAKRIVARLQIIYADAHLVRLPRD
jgi:hypothetical protein